MLGESYLEHGYTIRAVTAQIKSYRRDIKNSWNETHRAVIRRFRRIKRTLEAKAEVLVDP